MNLRATTFPRFRFTPRPLTVAIVLVGASLAVHAADPTGVAPIPGAIEACALLRVDAERLLCYDRAVSPQVRGAPDVAGMPPVAPHLANPTGTPGASDNAASTSTPSPAASNVAHPNTQVEDGSYFDQFWELTPDRKRGTFNFIGYRPNYFFPIHVTSHPSRYPVSPAPGHSGAEADYNHTEAKLQISVRTKMLEDVLLPKADLWFMYTQQSLWQLYSSSISRPFRSTDHQPEILYIVPTPLSLPFGFKTKMVGLGLAHQSNGQSLPYSRSWNRYYALGGIENGQFALTARYDKRIHESDNIDDNPDLTTYRGRTELFGLWSPGFMTLSSTWRTNFDSKHGSVQVDWTMPVNGKDPKGLRWYVQGFTGYGESLIEYNFRQSSLGAGLTLFGW